MVLAIGIFSISVQDASAIGTGYTGETPMTAGIGINGTVHDLRRFNFPPQSTTGYQSATQSDYLDRLCIFCHAPHHAYKLNGETRGTGEQSVNSNYTYLPLWNHVQTIATFIQYNPGPDAPDAAVSQKGAQSVNDAFDRIGATSLLCLSCHDGSVAVNEFGNNPQDTRSQSGGGVTIIPQYQIGFAGASGEGFLANHHPIGFRYEDVSNVDLEIFDLATAVYDHTIDIGTYGAVAGAINVTGSHMVSEVLWNGKMECSSCHAVHNTGNTGEKLLYVSDQNSNLCFSCHNKGVKTTTSTWAGGQVN